MIAANMPPNPFVGLRPFERADSLLFFGRNNQSVDLLQQLHRTRFLAVIGSSGCGKSSLIRAGLIPKLEAGLMVGLNDRWVSAIMKPGDYPRRRLAASLLTTLLQNQQSKTLTPEEFDKRIQEGGLAALLNVLAPALKNAETNLMLLVDQFEEVFRYRKHAEETEDFVSLMLALSEQRSLPIYVVMTMRSDFLGDCDAFFGLPEALNRSQYLVPRLTRRQRKTVIEGPVRLYGQKITPRLVDRLLNDVGDNSDQLPIMQHALMRIWENWRQNPDGPLDLPHYEAIGTFKKALSNHAEEALAGMSAEELALTRQIFQALTDTDASNRKIRRPAYLSEIAAITGAGPERVLAVIERFQSAGRSFLVVTQTKEFQDSLIDISHESLIRQWMRLGAWVHEEANDRDMYQRIVDQTKLYAEDNRRVWHDPDLEIALQWWQRKNPNAHWSRRYSNEFETAKAFLDASAQHRDALIRERKLQRQKEAKWKKVILATILMTVLISTMALLANYSRLKERQALKKEKISTVAAKTRYSQQLIYFVKSSENEKNLEIWDVKKDRLIGTVTSQESTIKFARFDDDDSSKIHFFASTTDDGTVNIRKMDNFDRGILLKGHTAPVRWVSFSKNDRWVATASDDKTGRIWDVETGEVKQILDGHNNPVVDITFIDNEGRRVTTTSINGTTRLWDADSGQLLKCLFPERNKCISDS